MTAAVHLSGGCVDYGGPRVVCDVDLVVEAGAIHVLLGESGSGKTTLLRAVAGFEPLAAGTLDLFGERVAGGPGTPVPPESRNVGVVFQDYALFPHLDVAGNLAFGMKRRDDDRIDELLAVVGLSGYRKRPVAALSGGEQQRVALARSLAQSPRLILFDEPFSNLNRDLRRTLRRQTMEVVRAHEITALFVTHDREEAFAIADRLSVMDRGVLLQTGTPTELYERPVSASVAAAVGDCAIVHGTVDADRFVCSLGSLELEAGAIAESARPPTAIAVRPEDVEVVAAGEGGATGAITRIEYSGRFDHLEIAIGGDTIFAMAPPRLRQCGDRVGVRVERVRLVDDGAGAAVDEVDAAHDA